MHFEDPILKEDGTLVTYIDIKLLKLAKVLAAPFREEEDETYTPALRRMFSFCGYYFIGFGMVVALLGMINHMPPVTALSTLYPSAFLGAFFIALSRWKRVVCTGTGTVAENRSDKIGALFALFVPGPMFGLLLYLAGAAGDLARPLETAIGFTLGILLVTMVFGYVRRLGEPPAKRKKSRVFRPAFLPH